MEYAKKKDRNNANTEVRTGHCLGCGDKLTFCGQPFTADIECPGCGAVNVYINSFKPGKVRGRPEIQASAA
jgi:ribosomal protein S27E